MRFKHFLNEVILKDFKAVGDRDWPYDGNLILISSENERYKIEGKTHGLISHTIKHLEEFDKNFALDAIQQIKSILDNQDNLWILNRGGKIEKWDKNEIKFKTLLFDTADYINDKIMNSKKLEPYEKEIKSILSSISKYYKEIVSKMIDSSINITNLKLQDIKNLKTHIFLINTISKTNYKNTNLYINNKDNIIIIERNNKIETSYKIHKIKNFLDKFIINNKDILNFFN